jgi:hypothetical protein
MINPYDIVRVHNQILCNKEIKKYYKTSKLVNNIISTIPISKRLYYDDYWKIIEFQVKYCENKLIMMYCLYYNGKYSQVNYEITEEDIIEKLKYFMLQ